jgi:general secretion pathway protein G
MQQDTKEQGISDAGMITDKTTGNGTEDGFTLVELLVVLAIIAMLATLIGPKVLGYLGGARRDTATFQIHNLSGAVDLYYLATGTYPTKEQGLAALMTAPAGVAGWAGPYLQNSAALTDPWGRPYLYQPAENGYVISSAGRDGQPGGTGEDEDIASNAK